MKFKDLRTLIPPTSCIVLTAVLACRPVYVHGNSFRASLHGVGSRSLRTYPESTRYKTAGAKPPFPLAGLAPANLQLFDIQLIPDISVPNLLCPAVRTDSPLILIRLSNYKNSIKKFRISINLLIFALMRIKKPESYWDVLIWATVLLAVFIGMGVLLQACFPRWGRGIWLLFLLLLMLLQEAPFIKRRADQIFPEVLSWAITASAFTELLLSFLDKNGQAPSWLGWLIPVFIILLANKLFRDKQKKEEEARKNEQQLQEPRKLLSESLISDRKALILLFNARMEDVSFEVDERMILYSLPDGRFLVLFRKPIRLEDFLHALSAFRTEVDEDEDAIGFYGQTFYGVKPDTLQAYVSDLSGVCHAVPFDLDSVSFSNAEPV